MSWPKEWSLTSKKAGFHGTYPPTYYQHHPPGIQLDSIDIYVEDGKYFVAHMPKIRSRWSSGKVFGNKGAPYSIYKVPFDYKNEPYFAMISGAYVASFECGIGIPNLKCKNPIIRSFAYYHLYYHVRRFMFKPELLDKYNLHDVKKRRPAVRFDIDSKYKSADGNYFSFSGYKEYSDTDFLCFIASESPGITRKGTELLQQSIESYVYCVLGAQANTRWPIVGQGAKSIQTQDVFLKLVEDTVVQSDITIMVSNMRKAIKDTNVTLDMAVVPGVILVPGSMIILDKPVPGFNNILEIASSTMSFGLNKNINYHPVEATTPPDDGPTPTPAPATATGSPTQAPLTPAPKAPFKLNTDPVPAPAPTTDVAVVGPATTRVMEVVGVITVAILLNVIVYII